MSPKVSNEEFARLFAEHHRRIFGMVRALVPHAADADEVFQETCVVLWREFANYDSGRPFAPWALAIARNQVRTYRHQARRQQVVFSETLVDELSHCEEQLATEFAERNEALQHCLQQLSTSDRRLVAEQYGEAAEEASKKRTIRQIAEQLGRPVNTVYKALDRIRGALLNCVNRRIASEERGGQP